MIELLWRSLGDAHLTKDVCATIGRQLPAASGARAIGEQSLVRDRLLADLVKWVAARERLV
jgi:hypothetical protein